jgi:2,3-bisphosphoglycerate-dependent phosphoglycerate mutase
MRLFLLARHGESTLNVAGRVNGDPSVPVPLTERGREEAGELGRQIANVRVDLCFVTRFARTRETAEVALAGRQVAIDVEPLLDDVDIGDLEGKTIDDYHAWKREHTRADAFPGGESLDDTARRYAEGFKKVAAAEGEIILVVCHEIPVRYALNALGGSDDLDGPVHAIRNAAPYLFAEDALRLAADRIEELSAR